MQEHDERDIDLTSRASFRHWTSLTIRFCDQDPMGHVNNNAYSVYFETSRVLFLDRFLDGGGPIDTVLARITIDFLHETHFPGTLQVGARLLGIGNKSVRSGYGLFREERCIATARCVNVFFDTRRRCSALPPERVREALAVELAMA